MLIKTNTLDSGQKRAQNYHKPTTAKPTVGGDSDVAGTVSGFGDFLNDEMEQMALETRTPLSRPKSYEPIMK